MAILSDFFTASPDEITQELLRAGPDGKFPVMSATSITALELSLLLHVVGGGRLDNGDDSITSMDEFTNVLDGGQDGPWMVELPDALCNALATASGADRATYAAHWREAEELAGIDQDTAVWLLTGLGNLARSAQAEGKALYLLIRL